jgi:hypothetical protein
LGRIVQSGCKSESQSYLSEEQEVRPVSIGLNPTAAVATTAYTVPTGYYAKFTVMYMHNTGGSTKHITVQWVDASAGATYDILTQYSLTAKAYLEFDGNAYIVLEEGDRIVVTTESGSSFSFIATFEETGLTRQ